MGGSITGQGQSGINADATSSPASINCVVCENSPDRHSPEMIRAVRLMLSNRSQIELNLLKATDIVFRRVDEWTDQSVEAKGGMNCITYRQDAAHLHSNILAKTVAGH